MVSAEGRCAARGRVGPFAIAPGLVAVADVAGSVWLGAGPVLPAPPGRRGLVEVSVMPGWYQAADSRADNGSATEFRSLAAIGLRLQRGGAVWLAVDYRSNGDLGSRNPGVNAVSLRFSRPLRR
jgi:hypothetical protein